MEPAPKETIHGFLVLEENENRLADLLGDKELAKKFMTSAKTWAEPILAVESDLQARPGYQSMSANEYLEHQTVLLEKVKLLAALIKKTKSACIYSGAGISTAAGIDDYASKGEASVAIGGIPKIRSHFDAQPTYAHFSLTALHKAGFVKKWVQQNHDGLPQKAGFPQEALNEIHGAWYDPANPVIKMSGSLREDLFSELIEWSKTSDFCLVVGTSLAGMNADRVAQKTASRALKGLPGQFGTVIVNLQKTQHDNLASLRIFEKIDRVMELLVKELSVDVVSEPFKLPAINPKFIIEEDCFLLRNYNELGDRIPEEKEIKLDLREDAHVMITRGLYKGHKGQVTGKHREGHIRVRILHPLKGTFMAPKEHTLGLWWIDAAVNGKTNYIPLVNVTPDEEK